MACVAASVRPYTDCGANIIKTMAAGKHLKRRRQTPENRAKGRKKGGLAPYWLYGGHAVLAAVANPARPISRIVATAAAAQRLGPPLECALETRNQARNQAIAPEMLDSEAIRDLLPRDAVHQGIAARVEPLAPAALETMGPAAGGDVVLVLDQVTDPHNVGAILRSAVFFGARAVVVSERHAPPESGVLAKAASGALESMPLVRVTNLARALGALKGEGYWLVGLDADAPAVLAAGRTPTVLVLGAEGTGLRRLTAETCDSLARIEAAPAAAVAPPSLNVSNAAAVALALVRQAQ